VSCYFFWLGVVKLGLRVVLSSLNSCDPHLNKTVTRGPHLVCPEIAKKASFSTQEFMGSLNGC